MLIGAGCVESVSNTLSEPLKPETEETSILVEPDPPEQPEGLSVTFPIEEYMERRVLKSFGEYIQDRFRGYHVGDDIEFTDRADKIPVYAMADGTVLEINPFVSGYGGVMRIRHEIDGRSLTAIYGHIDVTEMSLEVGSTVNKGDLIAHLGEVGRATDNERKHLHFALYEGEDRKINGYESQASSVQNWINPSSFLRGQGLRSPLKVRRFDAVIEPGEPFANLSFIVPTDMEVEYVPSIQSLNIFSVDGEGTARERSQIFIRFFDASQFLTLNTVTIHETSDLIVGEENYTARRYDIEKNPGVANFPDQPLWRNERHIVTDTRKSSGFTRYYVVASNPELDTEIYESFLQNLVIE